MPQTLKKLMGHIAFERVCVGACVRHKFCTYCNFYSVKANVLKFHIWNPYKNSGPVFIISELSPFLELWPFENF